MTNLHNELIAKIVNSIKKINDRIAVKKVDNAVILNEYAYGSTPPTTGVEGQIFFELQDPKVGDQEPEGET